MKGGEGTADRRMRDVNRRLRHVYTRAMRELEDTLAEFEAKHKQKDKLMRQKLAEGKISRAQYAVWKRGQVFQGKQWRAKLKSAAEVYMHADEEAVRITNGIRKRVFAEAANAELGDSPLILGVDFNIYDQQTVDRLLREEPNLLPPRRVRRASDVAWYHQQIANAVTRSIIEGDSIEGLARKIARETGEKSWNAAKRNARTAMTAAQNAGREEAMREVQAQGIQVKKRWLATLDKRTRDAHQHLDGQEQDVDKPFKSDLGDIMYPGDPHAHPANVYNCRCTLTYVYPEYRDVQVPGQRRDQLRRKPIDYLTYDQWKKKIGGAIAHTGGHDAKGKPTRPTDGWQAAHADRYYREVASREEFVDASAIARYTSFTIEQVESIRKHVFIEEHDFGDGEVHRFNTSYQQALAWQRLTEGRGTEDDELWLRHELKELTLEKEKGYNTAEAHVIASKRFPWWETVREKVGEDYVGEIPSD